MIHDNAETSSSKFCSSGPSSRKAARTKSVSGEFRESFRKAARTESVSGEFRESAASRRISRAFDEALLLPLDGCSRYVLFSDCHRGVGNTNDNFLHNEYLFEAALEYYFRCGFTYVELGDGDELWENRSLEKIKEVHARCFRLLSRFYAAGRLYMIYGNHDMVKKNPEYVQKHFHTFLCDRTCREQPLCPGIRFYPGIILQDSQGNRDIFLTHGHQTDLLNSVLWRISRFLVRYLWRPLEKLGVHDPTSAAKNNTRKKKSEQLLSDWANRHGCILISGHTHHPMIGTPSSCYSNIGSCVHPSGITAIEIEQRCLTLVKWSVGAREDLSLYAAREVLGETCCLDDGDALYQT